MNVSFVNPVYLWLLLSLPVLVIIHLITLKSFKARAWKFANFEAIYRVTGPRPSIRNARSLSKNILLLLIQIMALSLIILALANPVVWYKGKSSGYDYVLAIDASSSMLADDFEPNRFSAAKSAAKLFLQEVPAGTKVGVVSFAGTATIDSELTDDKITLSEIVDNVGIKASGGTDLGEAIITSANLLLRSEKPKKVVLLTDGRSTVGTPVGEGIEYAKKNKVQVDTIGVATEAGGRFLRINAVSTLDEETLKRIALATGGNYYKTGSVEELKQAYKVIAAERTEQRQLRLQLVLMLAAFVLLFVEWALVNTRFRTLP